MSPTPPHAFDRRSVVETLALATREEATYGLSAVGTPEGWRWLRKPETGLIVVRGRAGGGGAPFNAGEATVTRASVTLACGTVGHAYALGRDKAKAHACALLDAMWQAGGADAVERHVLAPVRDRLAHERTLREEEAAATTVDFFTMARESE